MRVALHDNYFSERGTTTSIRQYSKYLKEFFGYETVLIHNRLSSSNDEVIVNEIKEDDEVFGYSNIKELDMFLRNESIDILYAQKEGRRDHLAAIKTPSIVHAVFQFSDPHGSEYVYVSSWLARRMRWHIKSRLRCLHEHPNLRTVAQVVSNFGHNFGYLPLIVDQFVNTDGFREEFGIPSDAYVIGTLCGPDSFDIQFVRERIPALLEQEKDVFFLFPNITPFLDHDRVVFLPKIVDRSMKFAYLSALDCFLHARRLGESFGLGICEAMSAGVPVVSWRGGSDRHHVDLLSEVGGLYSDGADFVQKIGQIRSCPTDPKILQEKVREFSPERVAAKFNDLIVSALR